MRCVYLISYKSQSEHYSRDTAMRSKATKLKDMKIVNEEKEEEEQAHPTILFLEPCSPLDHLL